MSIKNRFKSYFLHGLAVLLPSILTIWLFVWGYSFIQQNISVHINRGLVRLIVLVAGEHIEVSDQQLRAYLLSKNPELRDAPAEQLEIHSRRPEIRRGARIRKLEKLWVEGPGSIAGFLMALVGVCILGAVLASVVGRTLWRGIEAFIMTTPFLRRVYPYVKQVTDFLLAPEGQNRLSFSRVVAVEYPRKGIWSLGLVTGPGLKRVTEHVRKDLLTVLIPTSPTPFTGFVIMVPRKQTIDLDITIEQAFRFFISGGVITPDRELPQFSLPRATQSESES